MTRNPYGSPLLIGSDGAANALKKIPLSGTEAFPDVDHFLPHVLKARFPEADLNGVWNLVLACQDCNRGPRGKFVQLPTQRLLERLNKRNEYLIGSNHHLRETLITQTGRSQEHRRSFLRSSYERAWAELLVTWEPSHEREPQF